jgi:Flp pilus assembly secretin CpaC
VDETELVMVITPHIVSSPIRQPASISMPPPQ